MMNKKPRCSAFLTLMGLSLCLLATSSLANSKITTLSFTDFDNNEVTLADFDVNKPYYLKFWASWCQPCMEQMPHLKHTMETYSDSLNVVSVNIALSETDDDITQVLKKFGFSNPVFKDSHGHLRKALKFAGTPYHVLVNTQGNVVYTTHEANEDLDRKIALLARANDQALPVIDLHSGSDNQFTLNTFTDNQADKKGTVIMFTATWCDWYLADTRPHISQQCIDSQNAYQQIADSFNEYEWSVVVSHLWTDESALSEFRDRYQIATPMAIDTQGDAFFALNVSKFPLFVVFDKGTEQYRTPSLDALKTFLN